MRWSKAEKSIIHLISLEEMIPEKEVERIIYSQFALLLEVLESGTPLENDLKNVMLPKFGKFYFSKHNVDKYRRQHGKLIDVV